MSVLLKILTGTNMGAESQLDNGEWFIGSDFECEIILMDVAIHEKHACLRVEEETVFLLPKEGDILINNEQIPSDGQEIPFFTPFLLGGTYLCIGPADRAWKNNELPTLSSLNTQTKLAIAKTADTENTNNIKNLESTDLQNDEEGRKSSEINTTNRKQTQKSNTKKPYLRIFFVLILLGVMCIGIQQYSSEDTKTVIQGILTQSNYQNVTLDEEEDSIFVQGYVPKNKDIVYLEEMIYGLEQPVTMNLFSLEEVKERTETLVDEIGALWSVRESKQSLNIAGYVANIETASEALGPIQEKLTSVKALLGLTTWQDLQKVLAEKMRNINLQSKVHFYPHTYRIGVATTLLTEKEEEKLEQTLLKIQDIYNIQSPFVRMENIRNTRTTSKMPTVVIQTEENTPELQKLCEQVQWENSKEGLVVNINGKQYKQGSRLPQGWLLQELNLEYAVFAMGTQLRVCNVNIHE